MKQRYSRKRQYFYHRTRAYGWRTRVAGFVLALIACTGISPAARAHLNSGRLKAIATAGAKRSALMPQVPTLIESGLPEFEYTTWYGVFVPARTPGYIVDIVNAQLHRALADRSIAEPLLLQGAEAAPSSPEALSRLMREEDARWKQVIRKQNLTF